MHRLCVFDLLCDAPELLASRTQIRAHAGAISCSRNITTHRQTKVATTSSDSFENKNLDMNTNTKNLPTSSRTASITITRTEDATNIGCVRGATTTTKQQDGSAPVSTKPRRCSRRVRSRSQCAAVYRSVQILNRRSAIFFMQLKRSACRSNHVTACARVIRGVDPWLAVGMAYTSIEDPSKEHGMHICTW